MSWAAAKNSKLLFIDAAGAALLLVIAAVFYWAGVDPIVELHKNQENQRVCLEDSRRNVAVKNAANVKLKKELSQVRSALAASSVRLERAAAVNQRIRQVTELATSLGLRVAEIQPGEAVYFSQYGLVPIHLAGSGGYRPWTSFAHRLSKECPDIWFDSFQLSGKPDNATVPTEFTMDLVWVVATEPVQTAAAEHHP